MDLLCPNDNTPMSRVTVEAHYGTPITLEQCRTCGGIWFDQFELYSAKPAQAEKIELLDSEILACPVPLAGSSLRCPRDASLLSRFSDVNFPKEITVARCPACGGFWLNRGEFAKYQQARERVRQAPPEEEAKLQQEIKALISEYKEGKSPDTLGKLGQFLSAEVEGSPLNPSAPQPHPTQAQRTFETVMNVVMFLLRLLAFRGSF